MSTATYSEGRPSVPHIGQAPHPRRNAWIATGLAALALAGIASFAYWRRTDAGALDRLTRFQSAYAERCDGTEYPAEAAALAKKLYLKSSTLRRTVEHQLEALHNGVACDEVYRALRAVDFPMASTTPPPRSATIDVPSTP